MITQAQWSDPVLYCVLYHSLLVTMFLLDNGKIPMLMAFTPLSELAVLFQWYQTKQLLRYGQCMWHFLHDNTVCLTARPVTNYGSHYDWGLTDGRNGMELPCPDRGMVRATWVRATSKLECCRISVNASPQETSSLAPVITGSYKVAAISKWATDDTEQIMPFTLHWMWMQ